MDARRERVHLHEVNPGAYCPTLALVLRLDSCTEVPALALWAWTFARTD